MAQAIQPPIFELGNFRIYLGLSAPPVSTSDGVFQTGDWIITGSPTVSSAAIFVCISGAGGNVAGTWKGVILTNSF